MHLATVFVFAGLGEGLAEFVALALNRWVKGREVVTTCFPDPGDLCPLLDRDVAGRKPTGHDGIGYYPHSHRLERGAVCRRLCRVLTTCAIRFCRHAGLARGVGTRLSRTYIVGTCKAAGDCCPNQGPTADETNNRKLHSGPFTHQGRIFDSLVFSAGRPSLHPEDETADGALFVSLAVSRAGRTVSLWT